jgi:hypothetical protein
MVHQTIDIKEFWELFDCPSYKRKWLCSLLKYILSRDFVLGAGESYENHHDNRTQD